MYELSFRDAQYDRSVAVNGQGCDFVSLSAIAYLSAIGKVKLNLAPFPSELFSAHILPL
jgi:hypothetical protein